MTNNKIKLTYNEWALMLDAFLEFEGKTTGEQTNTYNLLYDRFSKEVNFFDDDTEYTVNIEAYNNI